MFDVQLTGRLGSDPDLRVSKAGKPYLKLSMACDMSPRDAANGTAWASVLVFGDDAQALHSLVHRGDRVRVEGRLSLPVRAYTGKDGQPKASVDILAKSVEPLDTTPGQRPAYGRQATTYERAAAVVASQPAFDDLDDGIPF